MDRISLSYQRREAYKDSSMIIIGYEGKIKEPKYFHRIEKELIEPRKAFIHSLPPLRGESAPKRVLERVKMFIEDPKRGIDIEINDKIWFVLDVDKYPRKQFDEVFKYCQEGNNQRKLAISNPCFEIWLWMHHDDLNNLKSCSSKELKQELHNKQNSLGFDGNYLPLINNAVKRGLKTDTSKDYFPDKNSTKIYLLIEELLKYIK